MKNKILVIILASGLVVFLATVWAVAKWQTENLSERDSTTSLPAPSETFEPSLAEPKDDIFKLLELPEFPYKIKTPATTISPSTTSQITWPYETTTSVEAFTANTDTTATSIIFRGLPERKPDCPENSQPVRVSSSGQWECSRAKSSSFWEDAFALWGLDEAQRQARWIGGLTSLYDSRKWSEEIGAWIYETERTFSDHLDDVEAGISRVDICFEHDCYGFRGLVGSTDLQVSSCQAFVWGTEEGMFFLMRIDESISVCRSAFNQARIGSFYGASIGFEFHWRHLKNTGRYASKNGIVQPVFYLNQGQVNEITLVESYKDSAPADKNTWVSAIDLRAE